MEKDDKPKKKKRTVKTAQPITAKKTINRVSVLNTDGSKTQGLAKKKSISLKAVDNYQIGVKEDINPSLLEEKKRTKAIQSLLKSLHPGYQVPEETSFKGLTLSDRDLERIRFTQNSLKNCKLRECQLRGAVFKNCDLSGADLRHSVLKDVIFDSCNMNSTDLRGCDLTNARIVDSELFAANLDHAKLDHAVIDTCGMGAQSFFKTSCQHLKLSNSQIIHGFFDSADMANAEITHMLFRDCTLTNTHFERATLDHVCFRACDSIQEGPVFSGSIMTNITMTDCEFEEIKMVDTHISHSNIERVTMEAALFEGTIFEDVAFDAGTMKDCYSLEKAPSFTDCRLNHITIDHSELCNAHFNKSTFVGAVIIASDFEEWDMQHTGIDGSTTIELDY